MTRATRTTRVMYYLLTCSTLGALVTHFIYYMIQFCVTTFCDQQAVCYLTSCHSWHKYLDLGYLASGDLLLHRISVAIGIAYIKALQLIMCNVSLSHLAASSYLTSKCLIITCRWARLYLNVFLSCATTLQPYNYIYLSVTRINNKF